jgi:hypothetical protein
MGPNNEARMRARVKQAVLRTAESFGVRIRMFFMEDPS